MRQALAAVNVFDKTTGRSDESVLPSLSRSWLREGSELVQPDRKNCNQDHATKAATQTAFSLRRRPAVSRSGARRAMLFRGGITTPCNMVARSAVLAGSALRMGRTSLRNHASARIWTSLVGRPRLRRISLAGHSAPEPASNHYRRADQTEEVRCRVHAGQSVPCRAGFG